ncbi:hypothetical protein ACFQ4E_00785 [Litorisediminicola beolgyonensis]|uniref:Uncharacterized protein n=1 Tax=Litorisediminicola beolgyonensis TaxID=1173614 RepID=A0ABW3ZD00_9RHOB
MPGKLQNLIKILEPVAGRDAAAWAVPGVGDAPCVVGAGRFAGSLGPSAVSAKIKNFI